ncbi:nitroreductase family deazaflavin-dependent oxidoreductase [Tomitella biformata]|uniref:nitroreductase family deazaflavin-dependent oxidoreductase n=1 Tax=Tomitella biformata TaxID=630403 RepID=UPI0004660A93|nr:nitroreductase family deazaflavin-dependent oxidoreductase [Tomitella biformata]
MAEHHNSIRRAVSGTASRMLRTRWLVRAPITLYRARLGFLMGPRFLLLEHIGRKSGQTRYVVLEVILHPSASTYVVASGFGGHAQWFQNISANPAVRLHIGSRAPLPATARTLSPGEAETALALYAQAHPKAWAAIQPVLERTLEWGEAAGGAGDLPLAEFTLDGR